jgi:hypothetical protein
VGTSRHTESDPSVKRHIQWQDYDTSKSADSGLDERDHLRLDRMRNALPGNALFNSDEMITDPLDEPGLRTSEDRSRRRSTQGTRFARQLRASAKGIRFARQLRASARRISSSRRGEA